MTTGLAEFFGSIELFGDALLASAVGGLVLGWLGVWVVLRRMVFVSAAVSQAAGLGVALSFFAGIHLGVALDPNVGAGLVTLTAMVLFVAHPERLRITRESLLGLAYVSAGAAAVIAGKFITQEAHEVGSILFGSAVLVGHDELIAMLVVGSVLLALQLWLGRGIALASFDPDTARVQGVPVRSLNLLLFLSIGAMVSVSTRALGSLPVFAFTVLPAMAALTLAGRLPWALGLAAGFGALSGLLGYLAAFLWDLPVGASQTLVATFFAFAALTGRALAGAGARLTFGRP